MSNQTTIPIPLEFLRVDGLQACLVLPSYEAAKNLLDRLGADLELARHGKINRLEFFDDGIYYDGKPLDVRGNGARILREFEFVDTVSCLTLAERVWGDAMTPDINIRVAISNLNKKLNRTCIYIEKRGDRFIIHKPK